MADKTHRIDKSLIRDLAALLKETELAEIEIEEDGFRIRVSRAAMASGPLHMSYAEPQQPRTAARMESAAAAETGAADPASHPGVVPSPMVGTVFRAPDPGARPFVEVGDTVRAGQTILIVEAMKHMNEVAAPRGGKVAMIMVEDGQPVEYGEPLMVIE